MQDAAAMALPLQPAFCRMTKPSEVEQVVLLSYLMSPHESGPGPHLNHTDQKDLIVTNRTA